MGSEGAEPTPHADVDLDCYGSIVSSSARFRNCARVKTRLGAIGLGASREPVAPPPPGGLGKGGPGGCERNHRGESESTMGGPSLVDGIEEAEE